MSEPLHTRPGLTYAVYVWRLVVAVLLALLAALLAASLVVAAARPEIGIAFGWFMQSLVTCVALVAQPWVWRWANDARPRPVVPVLGDAERRASGRHGAFAGPDAPEPPRRW